MNTQERERQRQATLDAAHRRPSPEATNGRSEPPRPGDTFLSRRTADYPVEWLVVDDDDGRRVRVVPLDVHPFVGSHDVKRFASDAIGVLRCGLDASLDVAALEPELRTGTLTSVEMDEIRRRRQDIAERTLAPTLREEEVDTDPEYRLWHDETLRPALEALTRTEDKNVLAFPDRWRRWRPRLAAAALVVLAVSLLWQYERAQRLAVERDLRLQTEELRGVVAEVGRLDTELRETREASKRALADQKADFDERLEGIFDDRVVVNLPSFVLGGEARGRASRGFPEVIDPGAAPRFTLSVEVTNPEPYLRYRLRLLKNEGGGVHEVWSNDRMVTFNGKWLRLDLPTDLLNPGTEYELQVEGLNAEGATPLDERYRIQLNR